MKNLVLVGIGIVLLYLAVRAVLLVVRRAYLSRLLEKIDKLYANLMKGLHEELTSLHENHEKWVSGDKVMRTVYDEDGLLGRIADAKTDLEHQEAVHDKYFRVRTRYFSDSKKSVEAVVAYHNYLSVKMRQRMDAEGHVSALNAGAMTFDEFSASARQTRILVEECERRLDVLLA